jgi:hypothetical protein
MGHAAVLCWRSSKHGWDGGDEGLGVLRLRGGQRFALVTAALSVTELEGAMEETEREIDDECGGSGEGDGARVGER